MSANIEAVREELLATLKDLRDREKPMEPDRARAIAQVAGVLVDSARVEVAYIEAVGGKGTGFIPEREKPALPGQPDNRINRLR